MINFLNLKYFLILSEEMNFRKAAHKLYITQQSLSGHIQKLEEYFGVPLFYRSTPLRLTPAGIHLKNRAAELLTLESDLQKELLDISGFIGGSLTVGSTHVRTQVLLPSVLQVFNEKHPGVSICLFEGNTDEVEEALHSGTVDVSIGFLPKDTAQIISVPLYEEHFMVIIPNVIIQEYFPGHSVLQNGNPDSQFVLSCLKVCPFLSMTPDTKLAAYSQEYFRFLDFIPKPFLETKNVGTLLSLCSAGLGIIICPETFIRYSFYDFSHHQIYPIEEFHKKNSIVINYRHTKFPSSTINAFVQTAKDIIC